ncbi:unnamed protein product [Closterium sp. NIES-65]|nr:unnamed protein product [Closterium sp. NIES-65]
MRSSNIRRRVVLLRWRWSGAAALEVEWCCCVGGGVVLLRWRWSGAAALEVEWCCCVGGGVVLLRWRWSGAAALEVEWCCCVGGGVVLLRWRWSGAAALEVEWCCCVGGGVVLLRWRWSGAAALEVEWCCCVGGGVVLLRWRWSGAAALDVEWCCCVGVEWCCCVGGLRWRWSGAAALEVEWVPSNGSHLTAVLGCAQMDLAKENKSLKAELEKVRAALAKSESTCLALQKDLAGIDDSYQKRLGKQAERLALCQNELEKYQMKVEKLQREKKDIEESISVSSQQDTSASVVRPSEDQTASDADSSQAKGQENEQLDEHDSSNESSESRHALGNIGKCSTDGSSVEKEVTAVSTPETDQFSLGTAGLDSGVIDNIPDSNLKSELSAPRQLQLETALEATRKENSELRAQLEEKDMELARVRETATWQDMEMTKLRGMVKDLSLPDSALKVPESDPKALVVANEKINELEKKVSELASAKKKPKFLKFLCMS